MKEIIYLGKSMPITEEFEVFNNELGFDVLVKYWHPYMSHKLVMFHNITEVHYMFNKERIVKWRKEKGMSAELPDECYHGTSVDMSFGLRVALESDIQGNGGHRPIAIMESMIIKKSVKKYEFADYIDIMESYPDDVADKAFNNLNKINKTCI